MLAYLLPLTLVIASNTLYQICAKSLPEEVNPFASLTLTYLVAAAVTAVVFFATAGGTSLFQEYSKANWTSYVLGAVIVGLEVGMIYCYKAGWPVSTLMIVQCAVLAIVLLGVGRLLYGEVISLNKVVGLLICLAGLYVINR